MLLKSGHALAYGLDIEINPRDDARSVRDPWSNIFKGAQQEKSAEQARRDEAPRLRELD